MTFLVGQRSGTNPRWIQHASTERTGLDTILTTPATVLLSVFLSPSGLVSSGARETSFSSSGSSPLTMNSDSESLYQIGMEPPLARCWHTKAIVSAPLCLAARHAEYGIPSGPGPVSWTRPRKTMTLFSVGKDMFPKSTFLPQRWKNRLLASLEPPSYAEKVADQLLAKARAR